MPIEFDPNKDVANMARHGISLKLAESLEWARLLAPEDNREGYDDTYWVISLRKATPKEARYYASQI